MSIFSGSRRQSNPTNSIAQLILILLLLIPTCLGAIPGYYQGGNWTWSKLPHVPHLEEIKNLKDTGLDIPNWQIIEPQNKVLIAGKTWSIQILQPNQNSVRDPITLLLLPQNYYLDKPEVQWMDINGVRTWQTDSFKQLNFTITNSDSQTVKAKFFRAWNQQQTFAVVQWYAFPNGGSYANFSWFWQDLIAQLHHSRVPWIAVCLKIPLEPLSSIDKARPLAISLAEEIQINLSKRMNDFNKN
jgi:cyanoexosortase B-associated protein